MKTLTLDIDIEFERQECISCGCIFYISHTMGQNLRKNKASFYCPSGHAMSYTESESDRLRRQLATKIEENSKLQVRVNDLSRPVVKRKALRKAI